MSESTEKSGIGRPIGLFLMWIALAYAVGMSGYLSWSHYQKLANPAYKSACAFEQKVGGLPMDCDAVNASEYSEFLGIPLGTIGGAFFLSMLLLGFLAMGDAQRRKREAMSLILAGVIASFLYSLFLLYLQVYDIGKLCPFCISVYVANLIAFFGWLLAKQRTLGETFGDLLETCLRFYRSRAFLGAAFLFFLSLTVAQGAYLIKMRELLLDRFQVMKANLHLAPTISIDLTEGAPSLGPEEAPYQIVAYSDLGCPYCRNASVKLHRLTEKHPGQIRLIYRHFPLDAACNPYVPYTLHEGACEAAEFSICAQNENRFWEFHDRLYDRQSRIFRGDISSNLMAEAIATGLNRNRLLACLEDPETKARLESDVALGARMGVESTPSYLLNNRSFYLRPFALSGKAIDYFDLLIGDDTDIKLPDFSAPLPAKEPKPDAPKSEGPEPAPTPPVEEPPSQ